MWLLKFIVLKFRFIGFFVWIIVWGFEFSFWVFLHPGVSVGWGVLCFRKVVWGFIFQVRFAWWWPGVFRFIFRWMIFFGSDVRFFRWWLRWVCLYRWFESWVDWFHGLWRQGWLWSCCWRLFRLEVRRWVFGRFLFAGFFIILRVWGFRVVFCVIFFTRRFLQVFLGVFGTCLQWE